MAVVVSGVSANMSGHIQSQLTRSLERILEDANLSGELKLSGRKLKDFPKTGKYNLDDTVTADLSKNRFGEVPDEVTAFMFLEKLLLYHNSIRNVPDSISGLQSLSYLDLSRNQLSEVPRELCLLPLQVLLLSNNRLTCLPKELGRMAQLAELDASCNLLAQLPISLGELPQLRALNLRDNRLGLLPLQITYLQLELLDVSCNCISSLPLELRHMTQLVTLNLEHNPLVSPPATVCVRGRIHIFKYLEGQAGRDCARRDEARRPLKGVSATLPPNTTSSSSASSQPALCPPAVEGLRHRARYNVDSGYSTSDGGDKRWSSDAINCVDEGGGQLGSGRSTPSTPSTISPGPAHLSRAQSLSSDTPPSTPTASCRISPDSANVPNGDDKNRSLSHQQTYKQYKEALRQQRQQDVYRPRGEQISPPSANPPSLPHSHSTPHSPVANGYHRTSPSLTSSPRRFPPTSSPNSTTNGTHSTEESNKRPVQKVVPSRSTNNKNYNTGIPASNSNNTLLSLTNNGNNGLFDYAMTMPARLDGYTKPVSPVKESAYMTHNSVPGALKSNSLGRNIGDPSSLMNGDAARLLTTSVGFVSGSGLPSRINWNKEGPPDKLSFTMKREFDRAKEESELIQQLRSIIETRLKMSLPADLAPALSDGVVLCHLANNVRPRAVASVHVPSPGQPKLTMARCRRNVDNFLEACRRMGVEEKLMCCAADILEGKGAVQVAITVTELHRRQTSQNTHSQPNN